MVYIEYICDNGDIVGVTPTFNLYRNVMAFDTLPASKPVVNNSMILLSNVHQIRPMPAAIHGVLPVPIPEPDAHPGAGRADDVRAGCRRDAHRVDAVDRSSDQAVSDRNEGAPERVAAQRVFRVGAGRDRLHRSRQSTPASVSQLLAVVSTP